MVAPYKIGWPLGKAGRILDHTGDAMSLVHGSPALLSQLFAESFREAQGFQGIRATVQVSTAEEVTLLEQGPWLAPARQLLASKAKSALSSPQKNALRQFVLGSFATNDMLYSWGKSDRPECLCGMEDSIEHRLWDCQLLGDYWHSLSFLPKPPSLEEARLRWLRRLVPPFPGRLLEALGDFEYRCYKDGVEVGIADIEFQTGTRVCTDVSCLHPSERGLARAGAGIATLHPDGSVAQTISFPLPKWAPHHASFAEHIAVAIADSRASGDIVFVVDDQSVFSSGWNGTDFATSCKRPMAGL
mmetsp:Transcript_167938/g.534089  ORF Transcript_167938/g.534089 Transcript_167938/m.534089 type:complete len:301 (-) Transcript_167938:101-1003(-)